MRISRAFGPRGGPGAAGGWALLSTAVAAALGIGRTLLAAPLLGPGEVGAAAAALLVLAAADSLTSPGFDTALVSHGGRVEDELDPAFTLQALRGVALAVLVWCAAAPAAWFFGLPGVVPLLRALAAVPLLRGVENPALALLARRLDFRRLFWCRLPGTVAGFGVAVAVAAVRRDAWALAAAAIAAQAVATAASYAAVPWVPRVVLRGRGVRRLLAYGRWMSATRVLAFVSLNLDNLAVGRYLGAGALGVYQLAFRLSELPVLAFTRPVGEVALPVLAAARRDPAALRERFRRVFRVVLAVNCAFAAAALLAAPLVGRLMGPAWTAMVPLVRILGVATVFRSVVVTAGDLVCAIGRPALATRVNLVRVGVMAAALGPLLLAFGAAGVAGAVLVSGAAAAAVSLAQVRAATGLTPLDLLRPGGPVRVDDARAAAAPTARAG